jgi:hypothetical protein
VCPLFLHFGGGQTLHNVQSLIFRSLMEVQTICFVTSSSSVFLKILPSAALLANVAPVLSLDSLFQWCLSVSPDVSSRTSVL